MFKLNLITWPSESELIERSVVHPVGWCCLAIRFLGHASFSCELESAVWGFEIKPYQAAPLFGGRGLGFRFSGGGVHF